MRSKDEKVTLRYRREEALNGYLFDEDVAFKNSTQKMEQKQRRTKLFL